MRKEKESAPVDQRAEKKKIVKEAKITDVIELSVLIGSGTDEDPLRIQKEYWSKGGELLALNDPEINPYELPPSLRM